MATNLTNEYARIVIDIELCEIQEDFWAKQGDTGRGFEITLVSKGQIIQPTSELLKFHMLKPDGKQVWISGSIVGDHFVVALTNQSLYAHGVAHCEFSIVSMGKIKTTETFKINIIKNLTEGAYESNNEFGDIMSQLEDLNLRLSELEDAFY